MATTSISGLGSNLPIDSIISKLMTVESLPIRQLQQQQQTIQNKISAYGQVKGALAAFQAQVTALTMPGMFNSIKTSSSTDTVASLSVSSSSSAQDGSYNLEVTGLAQAQRLVTTGGFKQSSSPIGGGTLTFTFGATSGNSFTPNAGKTPATVAITANASLQDISDAINKANIGVQASIINDGVNGYRLVYTGKDTGSQSSMQVTVDNPSGALAAFTYDSTSASPKMQQLQAAQDASFKLNGITIQKPSNTVTDAVDGVTFTLKSTGTSTLTVAHDTSSTVQSVNSFVTAYNALIDSLNQVSAFDTSQVASGQQRNAAPLNGDSAILSIKTQLQKAFNQIQPGLSANAYRVPGDVGISFDRQGRLTLDSSKLQKAITANPQAVAALFGTVGQPSDSQIAYVGGGAKAKVGSYDVSLTALPHGVLLGNSISSSALTALSDNVAAGSAGTFSLTVDGIALNDLPWPVQPYSSAADVGQALQKTINDALSQASGGQGKAVTVTVDKTTGGLLLQSDSTGSSSSVTVLNGLESAGFAAGMVNSGQSNVAGTIGGYTAVGNGSTLTGGVGTPVAGLVLKVNGGSTGSRGTVSVTHGFANALNDVLGLMQSEKGVIGSKVKGLNDSVDSIGKNIDGINRRLDAVKQRYYVQYNAMDSTVSKLTSLGNYLTQQFASLSNSSNKKSS